MRAHEIDALNLETDDRNITDPVVKLRTGGGNLTAYEINELQDGNTYTLPAANSVPNNGWVLVELSLEHSEFTPTVQRAGSDTITGLAVDTNVLFDGGTTSVRFVSNGVNNWRI